MQTVEQPAQPKQPVSAHAAEDVKAELSTPTVDSPGASSLRDVP